MFYALAKLIYKATERHQEAPDTVNPEGLAPRLRASLQEFLFGQQCRIVAEKKIGVYDWDFEKWVYKIDRESKADVMRISGRLLALYGSTMLMVAAWQLRVLESFCCKRQSFWVVVRSQRLGG